MSKKWFSIEGFYAKHLTFAAVAVPFLWGAVSFIIMAYNDHASAADYRLFKVEYTSKVQHIDDTLDDLFTWFKIPRKKSKIEN